MTVAELLSFLKDAQNDAEVVLFDGGTVENVIVEEGLVRLT